MSIKRTVLILLGMVILLSGCYRPALSDVSSALEKSVEGFNELWESDLNKIWTITDKNDFLIAMNGWLCRKCNYGEEIEKLSDAEKVFYLNTQLESEVNNGGFAQFFYNDGGFADEIEESLREIGAEHTADIYKKAYLALGVVLPKDQIEREDLLDKIFTDDINEMLSECDNEFYEYPDNLEELNYQYIMNNKEQFS